ncbi:MAG: hypothetical protein JETT_2602 [Candidatus Jettenia ecosi]|uniref:Uncharacterized protein n=1 Tax=Candidatus Jettenia ecosi TaxID=2494326 RepID=A0A533Q8X5_9BACT|nr:MAG: hypothetical protein JETT_2602 [Candidatus Jettenia ecosi]
MYITFFYKHFTPMGSFFKNYRVMSSKDYGVTSYGISSFNVEEL